MRSYTIPSTALLLTTTLCFPIGGAQAAVGVSLTALDLNGDLVINSLDVFEMIQCFNQPASNPDCTQADFDGDGTVGYSDYQLLFQHYGQSVPSADVAISGDSSLLIPVGDSLNVVYSVEFTTSAPGSFNLNYSESENPLGGLLVSNDAFGAIGLADTETVLINETIQGLAPGEYTLTKTVMIDDPPVTTNFDVTVTVVDPTVDNPMLSLPGAFPSGIEPDTPTTVTFSSLLSGTSRTPDSVEIRKVGASGEDLGLIVNLIDDGVAPDGAASDFAFTGADLVTGSTEATINFRALAHFPEGDTAESPIGMLVITDLPIGLGTPLSEDDIFTDPDLNTEVVKGQVLVELSGDCSDTAAAEAAVEALGYEVLGYEPALCLMTVGVPTSIALVDAIAILESELAFLSAEANGVDVLSEWVPNDPNYATQWGFPKSRADEAWVISRGAGIFVGVIDTGADLDHPDLAANLWRLVIPGLGINLLGYDAVDGDAIPEDANSHGTHVAGTIAAVTNNATQVSGMAPNATLFIVRTLGPGGGSHAQFADGVKRAADMGVKIINYSGGGSHSATKQNGVNYAVGKGVLFIAAAGNDNTSSTTSAFPAAYANVMSIGSTTTTDGRSGFSNFGAWVSMAAPGSNILSLGLAGTTSTKSGTSMATPHVAGAAALVWATNPGLTAAQVQSRLEKTAKPLPGLQLGKGRLDVFNAIFNGSFENNLVGWTPSGTAASTALLGPLSPTDGARMGYISSGPAESNLSTTITQDFIVQPGVTSIPVQVTYNMVTEEFPEWVGTEFNDCTQITIIAPDGSSNVVAFESVNSSTFFPIGGINLPGGDDTVGQTGWKTRAVSVPVTGGPGMYRTFITDTGDDIFDSVVLLDDIRFKASVPISPLLAGGCGG